MQSFMLLLDLHNLQAVLKLKRIHTQRNFQFDLMNNTKESVSTIFNEIPHLEVVIHCASPYMTKPFLETTFEEMQEYTSCMLSDQYFAQQAIKK